MGLGLCLHHEKRLAHSGYDWNLNNNVSKVTTNIDPSVHLESQLHQFSGKANGTQFIHAIMQRECTKTCLHNHIRYVCA